MGTKEEAGWHFVIVGPKTVGRREKAVISISPSQNCCRTEGKVGKVQIAAKSGCLILPEKIPVESLELLRRADLHRHAFFLSCVVRVNIIVEDTDEFLDDFFSPESSH